MYVMRQNYENPTKKMKKDAIAVTNVQYERKGCGKMENGWQ